MSTVAVMRIRTLADRLGTTPHAIRFYERQGFLPVPPRAENGYREYADADVQRLRLLIGLRQLDLPLARRLSWRACVRKDDATRCRPTCARQSLISAGCCAAACAKCAMSTGAWRSFRATCQPAKRLDP